MKQFVIFFFTALLVSSLYAGEGTVVVKVKSIQASRGGRISVGIFEEENFPKDGKATFGQEVDIHGAEMEIVFNGIPAGEYGLAVYQDINSDGSLATNFIGYPKEPIGFSNDAKMNFGPPSFEDARFKVEEGKEVIVIITLK